MSDPVEQGEQVDVEATSIAFTTFAAQPGGTDYVVIPAEAFRALQDRVRLLEQREKGLREYAERIRDEYDNRMSASTVLEMLAASPLNEPSDA